MCHLLHNEAALHTMFVCRDQSDVRMSGESFVAEVNDLLGSCCAEAEVDANCRQLLTGKRRRHAQYDISKAHRRNDVRVASHSWRMFLIPPISGRRLMLLLFPWCT